MAEEEEGATGIQWFDSLDENQQCIWLRNAKAERDRLTPEQRTQRLNDAYALIRRKRQSNPLLLNASISEDEIIRELLNKDLIEKFATVYANASARGDNELCRYLETFRRQGFSTTPLT